MRDGERCVWNDTRGASRGDMEGCVWCEMNVGHFLVVRQQCPPRKSDALNFRGAALRPGEGEGGLVGVAVGLYYQPGATAWGQADGE